MATTHDFTNSNLITEFTDALVLLPNEWGLVNRMGLFEESGISQLTYTFDELNNSGSVLLVDKPRGERAVYGEQGERKTHAIPVPHFPYYDRLGPEDVQGIRRDNDPNSPTTLEVERAKVLDRARRNWAATLEFARVDALKGNVYAPNATVSVNWYTEFGQTQKEIGFNFADQNVTNNMINHIEDVIEHIQDNLLAGDITDDIVALCSKPFFSALINHPSVREAYLYFAAQNQGGRQPLRDRLGDPVDVRNRQFDIGGIRFIEYRAKFKDANGVSQQLIEDGNAYAFPMNIAGMYQTKYAPANRLSTVNTIGVSQYIRERMIDDVEWLYEAESNFINMVNRPQAVVKLISGTTP